MEHISILQSSLPWDVMEVTQTYTFKKSLDKFTEDNSTDNSGRNCGEEHPLAAAGMLCLTPQRSFTLNIL